MAGLLTNGMPVVDRGTGATFYPNLSGVERVPVDTQQAGGAPPQTVAATAQQIAALAALYSINTATSTSAAATLNTLVGRIVTESLSTAAGGTYVFTLTNSAIAATGTGSLVDFGCYPLGAVTRGLQFTSAVLSAGSAVITFTNNGTAALSGTHMLTFAIMG